MVKYLKKLVICFVLISLIIFQGSGAMFAVEGSFIDTYSSREQKKSLEEFIDGYFRDNMKKLSVPGAAIIIVKDNRVILKKGYGFSDIEAKQEVNPDKTSFPAASVSKLFTATAIMQLYEKGKIDLNEDINKYISPFKVENEFNEAVTCSNLLTHSSGLDEQNELDCGTLDINNIKSQEYYMQSHKAKVITKPNTITRYCNLGYNILGYIVEKKSDLSYEEYIKQNILKKLKMDRSNVRIYDESTAKPYSIDKDKYVEKKITYQYTSGSSGIIAPVSDMKNFMIANLNKGYFEGNRILNVKTLNLMQSKQFSNDESLSGMGYGFIRDYKNGKEILKHEGALACGYTTTMLLLPKENIGVYVATNSLNALPFRFEEDFLNYMYGQNNISNNMLVNKETKSKDLKKYVGTYRNYDGISKSNIMKIGLLLDNSTDFNIYDNNDGTLTLEEYTESKEKVKTKIIQENGCIFKRVDGKGNIVFRLDDKGNVAYLFNNVSESSYEKISLLEKNDTLFAMLILCFLSFLMNLIYIIYIKIRKKISIFSTEKANKIFYMNLFGSIVNIAGFFGTIFVTINMIDNSSMQLINVLYIFLSFLILGAGIVFFQLIRVIYYMVKEKIDYKVIIYCLYTIMIKFVFLGLITYLNILGYKI